MYQTHKRNTQISVPSQEKKKFRLQKAAEAGSPGVRVLLAKTPSALTFLDAGLQGGHWALRSRGSSPSQSKP